MLKVVLVPTHMFWLTGCKVIAGPALAVIVNARLFVCVDAPVAVPVTAILYVPADSVFALFSVTITLLPGITGLGAKVTVVPAGLPDAVSVTGFAKLPLETVVRVACSDAAAGHGDTTGTGDAK